MTRLTASYRFQFHPGFTFADALETLDYLAGLGVSHIYASPVFRPRKGSSHGYDVVDPLSLNPELGTREEFDRLTGRARELGLGWIQDIVPNHMAYNAQNTMLMDVVERGPSSPHARYFDIEWDHQYPPLKGRLLAPFLGQFFGRALEAGEIRLAFDHSGFFVSYYDQRYPLAVETYEDILSPLLSRFKRSEQEGSFDHVKLLGVLFVLRSLGGETGVGDEADQIRFVKELLWELYESNPAFHSLLDSAVDEINGMTGNPESFRRLEDLLSRQHFRLSFWKVAAEEINYRRFFNINELISLRIEDEEVFRGTHGLILELTESGAFTGLRIDHVDGLCDPLGYLSRLRQAAPQARVFVEKILEYDEKLPRHWPICGETGYQFLNRVGGLFCDPGSRKALDAIYNRFGAPREPFLRLKADKKRLIIGKEMAGDVDNLAQMMKNVSGRMRHGADITLYGLKRAIVEVLAHFPVYRTYVGPDSFTRADREYVLEATSMARSAVPGLTFEFDFIEDFLLLRHTGAVAPEEREKWLKVAMRFQQFTGPLMAKGFEDTLLYGYNRLLSLNEVGGSPERFGVAPEEFHEYCATRAMHWPEAMNATATHDTKRGEDARMRISALTEVPREWDEHLKLWSRLNRPRKRKHGEMLVPDRNDEYFLYQAMLGSWPLTDEERKGFADRLKEYLIKAVREAKIHTAWIKPDEDYESGFLEFVDRLLAPGRNRFLEDFDAFARRMARPGFWNSLSQTLLKMTAPGFPDFYQGTELWDFSFVDPDNRRPVDFALRRALLEESREAMTTDPAAHLREVLASPGDGRVKLALIQRVLAARRASEGLFVRGSHMPLAAEGTHAASLAPFARVRDSQWAVVLAPRMTLRVADNEPPVGAHWDDTAVTLPAGAPERWHEAIGGKDVRSPGGRLEMRDILADFPGALLIGRNADESE